MDIKVNVWEEDILLPTYGIGKPEKNPMFFENRVYQGSSGVVYPYPVIEKISDTCQEETYHALYLENEYIKVMILPELGGRVQMAYDKIKKRHFIYYNHVIKPALVGLTGPWISGGIEFNWPQHHRPSTYLPVDFTIEENADGSATVWVSERERMFHQKGMAGFTLRPGKAVLEIQGKLYNPTPVPQTFLWWANPAVAVNEIPWKNLIRAAFTECIELNIHTGFFKGFFPDVIVEAFRPCVIKSTFFICFKDDICTAAVTSCKETFQYGYIRFMPVITDASLVQLRTNLILNNFSFFDKVFFTEHWCPLERGERFWHKERGTYCDLTFSISLILRDFIITLGNFFPAEQCTTAKTDSTLAG